MLTVIGILIYSKINQLEEKVYNTNKFMHELLVNERFENLKEEKSTDIILGNNEAPLTMLIFSRYGCSVCSDFYNNVYPKLYTDFVEKGTLKIVIRQMVHTSRPKILYTSKATLFAFKNNIYTDFKHQISNSNPELDIEITNNLISKHIDNIESYQVFMNDSIVENTLLKNAQEARKSGVKGTPSFLIGNTKIYGSRPYKRFKKIIEEELKKL